MDSRTACALVSRVEAEINKVIVGQQWAIRRLLIGLLAVIPYSFRRNEEERTGYGHVLLEGVPGLAKTLTIMTLASTIDAKFQRIQFTPDMLPADIVGTKIYEASLNTFRTDKGPIFANVILADEINRATQKTQSALLEAMQERQVTIGENTFRLDEPFWVLATQNPVEQEGVYPLPEAQLDRFALKIHVDYPSHADEIEMLRRRLTNTEVQQIISRAEVLRIRGLVSEVHVDDKIREYIIRIIRATRAGEGQTNSMVNEMVLHGASPRSAQHLLALTRSTAFVDGRDFALPSDVKSIAFDALSHRVIRTMRAEAENITATEILGEIFRAVPIP
ncbi:MAG: ATPase [Bryobacterales bacterium]|nr:ATPase [Bryobacterales bacterium]